MLKVTMSYCRSNAYLVIGVCLGLSLSLMFAPTSLNECEDSSAAGDAASWYGGSSTVRGGGGGGGVGGGGVGGSTDEYEPQINLAGKPRRAQKTPKTFVRPRYYSTELGIREKLFVAVVTSGEYLHSRGVAINKTLAHLVDRVRYFISVPEGSKPNVTLPGIVGFTDTRGILKPFHVVKYISDNYLEDYDYYYVTKDTGYVNARRLREIADAISVSRDVHLGVNVDGEDYCSLDAGILLSNSLVRKLKTSLDWCVKNTFSSSDDVNFGRCVLHATEVPCTGRIQGEEFRSTRLGALFDFDENFAALARDEQPERSISIYPVFDHRAIYKINAYLAATELRRVEREIGSLRRRILESAHLGPQNQRNTTWPVGNQPGNRALGRFDLLPWIYLNETHSFMDSHAENARESVGSARLDFARVLEAARRRIESEYRGDLRYDRLVNGYRRFDASRGMDYILDLRFIVKSTGKTVVKRIEICKPLGKVEILPVPYVTENSRINMIHVVDTAGKIESAEFLERYAEACMEKKDKTFLMLVLLYEPDSPSKGASDVFNDLKQRALALTERYKKDQSKVTWLSVRLPIASTTTTKIDPLVRIAIADLAAKKFTPESLLLFVDARMDLKIEYLNRVRMNTISQWQVYSPIPFVEYDPDVAARKIDSAKQSPADVDVNRNAGRYDDLNYDSISFYVKDYLTMRRKISPEIPQVRTDRDIATLLAQNDGNAIESMFQLFVEFSDLHAFRAVEPALKIRSGEIRCEGTRSSIVRDICERRRNLRLGHRGQLAKLILDYQNQS